jgi:hypothetical protein
VVLQSLCTYVVRLQPADLHHLPAGAQLCRAAALLVGQFARVRVATTREADTLIVATHSGTSDHNFTGRFTDVARGAPPTCAAIPGMAQQRFQKRVRALPCKVSLGQRLALAPMLQGPMQHTAHVWRSSI